MRGKAKYPNRRKSKLKPPGQDPFPHLPEALNESFCQKKGKKIRITANASLQKTKRKDGGLDVCGEETIGLKTPGY